MEFLFALCIILAIVTLMIGITSDGFEIFIAGFAFSICVGCSICAGVALWSGKSPTTIDVYRGKTTLEITYRDSVAVDSVVVWNEETK